MQTPLPDPHRLEVPAAPPIPLPTVAGPASTPVDNTMGGMIPTGNQNALWAYYIGLFSLLPGLGLVMGPAAVWLGISGLKFAKRNPAAKGKTHAWVGIVCGGFWTIVYWGSAILLIRAFAMIGD